MPSIKSVSDIKSSLLRPALTSHYLVQIGLPSSGQGGDSSFRSHLQKDGITLTSVNQDKLNLLCSEASLPGSSVATFELNNDRTGTTERHAHRKFFDDRIDFTFYVDVEEYMPIMFFESWIKYITGSGTSDSNSEKSKSYYYRMNYPDEYTSDQGLTITKFERDTYKKGNESWTATGNGLVYTFIRTFPISITSMPVSYDNASLLKCTVSMSYIRYTVERLSDPVVPSTKAATTDPNKFNSTVITNEYYSNFGDNRQNATNTADFFNGSNVDNGSVFGLGIA